MCITVWAGDNLATIKDIAKKTNLSITTISMVLNNRAPSIPQKTKDLVIKTAKELNYIPNQSAVALVTKRTNTMGLIVPDIRNDFFSSLAKGIEDECMENNWTVILCNSNDMHERETEYIKMLSSKGVDGILYCVSTDTDKDRFEEKVNLLESLRIKSIAIDRFFEVTNLISISMNHLKGGYIATKHLLDLGHEHIACVTGPRNLKDSNDRLKGYLMAIEEHGIAFDESLIVEGDYRLEGGFNAVNKLLEREFTAVFAFNDMMAYGAFKALKKNGFNIPKDISIVGYDDIYLSEMLEIPLTTVHQPVVNMGKASARHLIELINNKKKFAEIPMFEPHLVIRSSTTEPYNIGNDTLALI